MTDHDYILEQLEQEWRELGAGIRQEKMEKLFMNATATATAASELTAAERESTLAFSDQTDKLFLEAISGLSDAQWTFRSGANRWSIQEIAEHIILVESMLSGGVAETIQKAADPSVEEVPGSFEMFKLRIMDRSVRGVQAPDPVSPKAHWTIAETVQRFQAARAVSRELLTRPGLPLKSHVHKAMPGAFSCYHWLTLVSMHTRRHLAQILEVKTTEATAGFPK